MSKHKKFLFSGEPPLKLSTAKSIQEMIEKALEITLTDEQIKLFQKRLILEWQENKKTRRDINKSEKMAEEIEQQIQALPLEKQPFAWREFGRQVYIYAENEGKNDPVGQLIMSLYQRKHNLLVKGNPPLSRQAAESYAEMNVFVNNVLNNSLFTLEELQKEELINELVKSFPSLPLEQQENISKSDAIWGQLRYNWKLASSEEKENFQQEIKSYLPKQTPSQTPIASTLVESDSAKENCQTEESQETLLTPEVNTPTPETTQVAPSKVSQLAVKLLPPKFLDTVSRLRAKVSKVTLISSKKPE